MGNMLIYEFFAGHGLIPPEHDGFVVSGGAVPPDLLFFQILGGWQGPLLDCFPLIFFKI